MRTKLLLCVLLIPLMLTACAHYDFSRRMIQQGTLLSDRSLQQLHIGMSKEEVSLLLGTSLTSPMFNMNRWEYSYSKRMNAKMIKRKTVILYFNHDHLTHLIRK